MKSLKKTIVKISLSFCLLLFSLLINAQYKPYSFFVAGHTYGTPGTSNIGLFSNFVAQYPYIQSRKEIKFGILTGDVVKKADEESWNAVDEDIENLGLPVYIAVGNHDMKDRELYEQRYGITYFYFVYENDLFIVLDPNLENWNISQIQIDMINEALTLYDETIDNIFVFFHQVLWWETDNIYKDIVVNSTFGRADEINFWTEVEPIFFNSKHNVTMFAGDVGATGHASNFMYDKYLNISFIASGMGNNINDHFVVVNVDENKKISFDLVCLDNSEINCFGEIEQFDIYDDLPIEHDLDINIFPNPVSAGILTLTGFESSTIEIFDVNGKFIETIKVKDNYDVIDISFLSDGIYIIKVKTLDTFESYKIIKH